MKISINCDMGEGFGIYSLCDEEAVMPYITDANLACGFHASDPTKMRQTVALAARHNVKVGAHFSYPDLQGFGRRFIDMGYDELVDSIVYQIGALSGFLNIEGLQISHLKPHGALYTAAAKDEKISRAIADVAGYFNVPVFGLSGTSHETVYKQKGIPFVAEFFADLEYDRNGNLVLQRNVHAIDSHKAASRALRAVKEGLVETHDGVDIEVDADTICVHSDSPNALNTLQEIHKLIEAET